MSPLISQPTGTPTRKVSRGVGAYGGTASTSTVAIIMYALAKYYGGADNIPQDDLVVAPVFASILTTIINFICAWWTKEHEA